MKNNTCEDTNVMFSKTLVLSDASDCSNDIEFPPPTFYFLLFSPYSRTTATIVDIPIIAVVIISTTSTKPGKEKI
jgi:hypothetical protein